MIEPETLQNVGSGAGGGLLGVILTWFGLKSRLDSMEKTVEGLVTEKICEARTKALVQRIDNARDRFDKIDLKLESLHQVTVNAATEASTAAASIASITAMLLGRKEGTGL